MCPQPGVPPLNQTYPNTQPAPVQPVRTVPVIQDNDNIKRINDNFAKHRKDIESLKQSIVDVNTKLDKQNQQLGEAVNIIGKVNQNVTTIESTQKTQHNIVEQLNQQNQKSVQTVEGLINGINQKVETSVSSINTEVKETKSKLEKLISVGVGAAGVASDFGFLKYLLFGNLGLGGIALAVAVYAVKKKGPTIVKHIYEKIKGETNPGRYIPPAPGTYQGSTADYTSYPTEGVHPHVKVINEHDNMMTGGSHPVGPSTSSGRVRKSTEYVVQDGVPQEQLIHPHINYVPYETNDFRVAYEKAASIAGKRYPGQIDCLDYVNQLISQFLNANPGVGSESK